MKYPISEMLDRCSIEKLKEERIPGYRSMFRQDCLEYIVFEFEESEFANILCYIDELHDWNGKIWDLESDIRKGKEGELGLEEVGRRALMIRDLNNKRIEVKNRIASEFDQYIEVKHNHASQ